jgi:hypothetical protein
VAIKTQFDLMAAVVVKLAGKPVTLRYQKPATEGMTGECHKAENGRLVIDITPHLPDETLLFVLCHEAAHARLHEFKPSTVYKAPTGSLAPSPNTLGYQVKEIQADTLAAEWIRYAKVHGGDDFEDQLTALLTYYER